MLKNVQQAKFDQILSKLAVLALDEQQLSYLSFEAFFTHILCHELLHGLGPHRIQINENGKIIETTVR